MMIFCKRFLCLILILATTITFSLPRDLWALDEHVVSSDELQRSILIAAQERQEKIARIQQFFATEPGTHILKQAGVTSTQIERAVPQLSDQELTQLSLKTDAVQQDFAGGMTDHELVTVLIIVLLVVAIVAIVTHID
jgi:hypothetical protein